MIARQELRLMSFAEKMELLEAVWSEISTEPASVEVPQWHKDILDERESALKSGQDEVLNWDDARKQIEQATR